MIFISQTVDLTGGQASFTGGDITFTMKEDVNGLFSLCSGHFIDLSVRGLDELHKTFCVDHNTTDVILGMVFWA